MFTFMKVKCLQALRQTEAQGKFLESIQTMKNNACWNSKFISMIPNMHTGCFQPVKTLTILYRIATVWCSCSIGNYPQCWMKKYGAKFATTELNIDVVSIKVLIVTMDGWFLWLYVLNIWDNMSYEGLAWCDSIMMDSCFKGLQ